MFRYRPLGALRLLRALCGKKNALLFQLGFYRKGDCARFLLIPQNLQHALIALFLTEQFGGIIAVGASIYYDVLWCRY